MQTTEDIVAEIVAEQLGIAKKFVTPEKHLTANLGVDVLDAVEIILHLEDRFNILIPEDDAEKFRTVSSIIGYLKSKGF